MALLWCYLHITTVLTVSFYYFYFFPDAFKIPLYLNFLVPLGGKPTNIKDTNAVYESQT